MCARAQMPMSLRVDLRCRQSAVRTRARTHTHNAHTRARAPSDVLRDAALLMVKHQARDAVQVQQQIQHRCVVFGEGVQGLGELALRQSRRHVISGLRARAQGLARFSLTRCGFGCIARCLLTPAGSAAGG